MVVNFFLEVCACVWRCVCAEECFKILNWPQRKRLCALRWVSYRLSSENLFSFPLNKMKKVRIKVSGDKKLFTYVHVYVRASMCTCCFSWQYCVLGSISNMFPDIHTVYIIYIYIHVYIYIYLSITCSTIDVAIRHKIGDGIVVAIVTIGGVNGRM